MNRTKSNTHRGNMNHTVDIYKRTRTSLGWKEYWNEDQMAAPPVRCRESSATTSATKVLLCSATSGSSSTFFF